jgi:hypothetical protein
MELNFGVKRLNIYTMEKEQNAQTDWQSRQMATALI